MKELTIEEKAKRYDEAIKKARNIVNSINVGLIGKNSFEAVFPELKESEDEKIRKELLQIAKESEDTFYMVMTPNKRKRLIDWLENQNKKAEPIAGFASEFEKQVSHLIASAINKEHEYNKGYVKWAAQSLIEYAKREIEKQGEQKPADIDNKFIRMRETKPKDISEFLDRLTTVEQEFLWEHIAKVRELDKEEQKPADKIEPKFKVGDWIIHKDNKHIPIKIIEEIGMYYRTVDTVNYHHDMYISYINENYRLWTNQDAKDGDVLAVEPIEGYSSSFVAIYKKQNEEDFDSYCFVGFDGKFYKNEHGHSTENIHPATTEQRDLLFQKMKEAGYEWDADKRELKKMEQTPVWTGEDEKFFKTALWHISNSISNGKSTDIHCDTTDWFKSLKDRLQTQKGE